MPGPCGGTAVYWGTAENIHWCPADDIEVAEARLAGVSFAGMNSYDLPVSWFDKPWLPGTRVLLTKRYFKYVDAFRNHKWAILRHHDECPYRRAPVDQSPQRAREKANRSVSPVDKRRLRKAIAR